MRRRYLENELKAYMEITPMTEEERTALEEWVADGNSVRENPSMASNAHGHPADFLDDYRFHEAFRAELEAMSEAERERRLAMFRGQDELGSHVQESDDQEWPFQAGRNTYE